MDITHSVQKLMKHDIWVEFPGYERDVWRKEVTEQNTQLGYWDWVSSQLKASEAEIQRLKKIIRGSKAPLNK